MTSSDGTKSTLRVATPMRGLRSIALLLALTWLIVPAAGCDGEDCGRAICGCWESVSVNLDVLVLDQRGEPVEGMQAVCINEDSPVGTTDGDGRITANFDTRLSQVCGTERCNSLTLSDPEGRCGSTQSSLLVLNSTTVTVDCSAVGDDDDSAR